MGVRVRQYVLENLVAVVLSGAALVATVATVTLVVGGARTGAVSRMLALTLVLAVFAGVFWLRSAGE